MWPAHSVTHRKHPQPSHPAHAPIETPHPRLRSNLNSHPLHLLSHLLRSTLGLLRRHLRLNLANKELHALIRPHPIRQMRRQHQQLPQTHRIPGLADDFDLVRGEIRDLVPVLQLLGVAVEDHAGDLVLDGLVERLDRAVVDGGALGVAAGDDDGVWAFLGHGGEGLLHQALGDGVGAAGDGVGADAGGVADAFGCDFVGAEGFFEAIGCWGADDGALRFC